jgi:hypothetical protein
MRNTSLLAHELLRLRLNCFYEVQPSSPSPESPAMRTLSKKAARNFHALVLRAFESLGQQRGNEGARMKLGDQGPSKMYGDTVSRKVWDRAR